MMRKMATLRLIFLVLPIVSAQVNNRSCHQTCGSDKTYPYPFGFSSGCDVQLNCTQGAVFIGGFPVQYVGEDTIMVNVIPKCNRPIDSFRQLFSQKYAPTARNALLLQNCIDRIMPCLIPKTLVQTHFDSLDCNSGNGNLSCYSDNTTRGFLNYDNITNSRCQYLMSSIMANHLSATSTPVSLEVAMVELGWWLQGDCKCSADANCTKFDSPMDKKPAYRCRCNQGFIGDGYSSGTACRKVSSTCNTAKFMSGPCGGKTRFVVLIGGIVLGTALMISLGLIFCLYRGRRVKLRVTKSTKRRLTEATGHYSVPIYSYKDIEKATNGFSEKQRLGNGAYGTVYAGKLNSGDWVAIKRIKHRDTENIEQVMNEIKLLSSVSHPNLVRLLGCCLDYGEQILVYEFMPNGTLYQHLHKERGDGLSWPIRFTIAAETAQAIAYLHSAINAPIYHRDIKSSNILLDYNFRSKVADFGLSRLGMSEISHVSTIPQGTPGYVDPQYHQDFQLSDKSDVYSFGVVLVEIITGLKVVDFLRPQNEVNLAALATDRIGKGVVDEIIDPFLQENQDAYTLPLIHKVVELAFRCLAFHRDMRPSMIEVAAELEQIRLSVSCSPSYVQTEEPLSLKDRLEDKLVLLTLHTDSVPSSSMEKPNNNSSPVSVQDPELWLSEQSSPPSSTNLLH